MLGVRADVMLGEALPAVALSDAALNSQHRFYEVTFALYGVLHFACATDLRKYATVLRGVLWVFYPERNKAERWQPPAGH